jgi:hypothetical protein
MRDALFRAAQLGAYAPLEDVVGGLQNEELTVAMWDGSFFALSSQEPAAARRERPLVVWPYPRGTADILDRANCADAFLRDAREYELVTEPRLEREPLPAGACVVFAPFEALVPRLRADQSARLCLGDRPVDALVNELSLGYLIRNGVLDGEVAALPGQVGGAAIVNGTRHALLKGRQLEHVATLATELRRARIAAPSHALANDADELASALAALAAEGASAVVRPFAASQGTGIGFVTHRNGADPEPPVDALLAEMRHAVGAKYGSSAVYPLTVTPFVESVLLDGCVTDLRIFVVYDPDARGLRALPGLVRRARVPLRARPRLEPACAATNIRVEAPDAVGPSVFPLTAPEILERLGLDERDLVPLGAAAASIWGTAVERSRAEAGADEVPFAYGSVDFVVRASDGDLVPIELNGANVGAHPSVHPEHVDRFATACVAALHDAGC